MSSNTILIKNLEIIEKYNPLLKEKLLGLTRFENDIKIIETELNETNFSYNGIPLHSQKGALAEAKTHFGNSNDNSFSTHFLLGIGVGYLFKEFCAHSIGRIVLYEPNLEILRISLEKTDFTRELSKENVWVVSDSKELNFIYHQIYTYKADTKFSILNSYRSILGLKAQAMLDEIKREDVGYIVDFNIMINQSFDYISTIMDTFPYVFDSVPLAEIKDIYKGKTALIVSAGPTLDLNIEKIKKHRDKFILFCVGTAAKTLFAAGIKPDFLNIVEVVNCSSQVKNLDLSDVNMILEPSTHLLVHKTKTKQKFIFIQKGSSWGVYLSKIANLDISQYIAKGTVSFQALTSAKILGFKKMILVGQDLAFINDSCYSKNTSYSQIYFEKNPETNKFEFKFKDYNKFLEDVAPAGGDINDPFCKAFAEEKLRILNEKLVFVKGINGDMLPTEIDYSLFIDYFKEFAEENKDLELINTSMLGAQLDGFENMDLEKALEGAETIDKVETKSDFKFDKNLIAENLKKDKQLLDTILEKIEEGIFYLSKFERAMATTAFSTPEAHQSYTRVMQIYDVLWKEYFNKSQLYIMISFAEHTELQYTFKKCVDLNVEGKIASLYQVTKEYFTKVQEKILILINKMEKNIEILSEQRGKLD